MVSIKTLYFDVGNAMKGICDKLYSRSRPKAVDTKINSYIVVYFPSSIYNNEMNSSGVYNDFTTTAQIELYVRDKASAKIQTHLMFLALTRKSRRLWTDFQSPQKSHCFQSSYNTTDRRWRRFFRDNHTGKVTHEISIQV